jgi:hypothetical protein
MAIPSSGFCLSTVKNEFVTPRYGEEKMTCFLHWASQNTIAVGNMGGCTLSQFANKSRTTVSNMNVCVAGGLVSPSCFYAETTITDVGNDMRTSNSTEAQVYISYCITNRCGLGSEELCTTGTTSACITSTNSTTVSTILEVTNPYPGAGNAETTLYACGVGFNGFGESTTGSPVSTTIQWLDIGD